MDKGLWVVLAVSSCAGAVTTFGILITRQHAVWARRNTTYFASFAAGVLIAASFMHIVARSFAMNAHAPVYLLAGYLLMYLFNRFISGYVCDKDPSANYALGLVPLLGIGFHSFLDGVIYSIGFHISLLMSFLVAIGMVLHEFPEGIVTYALLIRSGFSEQRSFMLAFLAAAMTTPVGATHLLPRTEHEPRRFSLLALAAGTLVAVGIILSKA